MKNGKQIYLPDTIIFRQAMTIILVLLHSQIPFTRVIFLKNSFIPSIFILSYYIFIIFHCINIFSMLDFFSIFTKGGLVLWYFQAECLKINLQEAINEFIRYSIIDVSI